MVTLLGFELPPLAVVAIALVVILVVSSWVRTPANLPPCPVRPYPVLGHLPHLVKDPRGTIMTWSKQTGEIFSLYFGSTLVVVLSSYDILKESLVKQADLFSDKPKDGLNPLLKSSVQGIVFASGAVWKENRTTVLSILKSFGMGKNVMAEKIEEELKDFLVEVDKLQGEATDMKEITTRAISNIICNLLLGKRFEYSDPFYREFMQMFENSVQAAAAGTLHRWFPSLRYIPGDPFKTKVVVENREIFNKYARAFIQRVEDDESSGVNKENVIAHYLREMREKKAKGTQTNMCEESLWRIIGDLMLAGSETTASTIGWFFLYMIHNPHVQKKVHAEIDEEIGSERNPQITDRARLTYMNAAILETQRAASIVPLGLFHRCTGETTLRGYTIPKDTLVMPHLDAALHSEQTWGDPETFRPERFLDAKGSLLTPEQVVPFSLGRRVCLGEALAKAELFLFLTHILQKYQVAPEDPKSLPTFDSILGVTRAPASHKVRLVRREGVE